MDWECSDVFRFDLGPTLQIQMRVLITVSLPDKSVRDDILKTFGVFCYIIYMYIHHHNHWLG